MVDVRDDAEVADAGLGHGGNISAVGRSGGRTIGPWDGGASDIPGSDVTLYAVTRPHTERADRPVAQPADRPAGRPSAADAGMLLVCLIWGVNFSVMKLAIAQIPAAGVHRDPVHHRERAALARAPHVGGADARCRRPPCGASSSWVS